MLAQRVHTTRDREGDRVVLRIALAWRPSRRLSVRAMWALWLVCLVFTPGALWLAGPPPSRSAVISSIRVAGPGRFLWLVLAWLWPERDHVRTDARAPRSRSRARGHRSPASSSAMGARPPCARSRPPSCRAASPWRATAGASATTTSHRTGRSDIVDLSIASIIGRRGGAPARPAPGVCSPAARLELLWWTAAEHRYVFVGGACIMLLVQRRPQHRGDPDAAPRRLRPAARHRRCLGVVFTFDDLPLTWIVLLPAVWAGHDHGPVDRCGLQPDRHAGGRHRPGDPGRQPALRHLRPAHHRAAGQPDGRLRPRGAAALPGARPAGPPRRRGGRAGARRRSTRPACSAPSSSRSTRRWC